MAIEADCPGCGRRLRVGDEHAGKEARCPVCNFVYVVPGVPAATAGTAAPEVAGEQWSMRTPEGRTYGPVSKQEIDRWVAEGRVSADCQLQSDGRGTWQDADAVFPVLRRADSTRFGDARQERDAAMPVRPGQVVRVTNGEAHRGALILALGILSWFSCPLFGVLAWALGSGDLRQMRDGRMDPSGMALTQVGYVLGMIHVILCLLLITVAIFIFLVVAITSH